MQKRFHLEHYREIGLKIPRKTSAKEWSQKHPTNIDKSQGSLQTFL